MTLMTIPEATPEAASSRGGTPAVEIVGVGKAFGSVTALAQVDLTLEEGDFLAVLGPSGCGKTTLLRCMAGFERIDAGRIALGGRAVALPGIHLPPHRRHVAVVPQEGALFPHLSVAENVGFGLSRRGRGRARRIEESLELVGLAGLGARMPHELSGGQQQRVALARALAPRPPLVLLDEPFSALDASLRVELRHDVRAALREAGATAILVTHDQGEALSMADRVAVMRDGQIRQVGTPVQVYGSPVDAWVATFVGEADLVDLPADVGSQDSDLANTPLGPVQVLRPASGNDCSRLVVRPEQVLLEETAPEGSDGPGEPVTGAGRPGHGVVTAVDFHGHDALVTVELADGTSVHSRTGAYPPAVGATVHARIVGACRAVPDGGLGPRPHPATAPPRG